MKRILIVGTAALGCFSCGDRQAGNITTAEPSNESQSSQVPSVPTQISPGEAGGPPEERARPPEEPIDPRSAQGAAQVLQRFAALIEQGRFGEASRLGEEDFAVAFPKDAEMHTEIGPPGPIQGAAGSLYVEIPVRFHGRLKNGRAMGQSAVATLRRSNDVPGATAEQRKWRIYRLDMQPPS